MKDENFVNSYAAENEVVSRSPRDFGAQKKKGLKVAKIFIKLLKTNVEKMSTFGLSMMLMKKNELQPSLQDVDENKGSY